jgi:predicted nucleic acid-binding protein
MQPPRLVAVDSNVLLALAEGDSDALDAWELIQTRLRPVMLLVPPTVLDEIGHKAEDSAESALRNLAIKALTDLRARWNLQPVELRRDQEAIVESAATALWHSGQLPFSERNDAFILVEAAVLECMLLVSHDSHLLGLQHIELKNVLRRFHLIPP